MTRGSVGPFALERSLGSGGTARVWEVTRGGLRFALKAPIEPTPGARSSFEREISAMASLVHPGIARILDRGVASGSDALPESTPWFVMERADGSLDASAPLAWPALRVALDALLDALAHAHGHGVLHRDLKPANVLRFGDRVAIADFGMARVDREPGSRGGTPGWMAPEQASGARDREGPWTDLFALGHLAAALAGHDAPTGLGAWIAAAREPDPRRRFRSAAEAREGLARIGSSALGWTPPDLAGPTRPSAEISEARAALPAVFHPLPDVGPPAARHLPPPLAAGLGAHLLAARVLPVLGRDAERERLWTRARTALQTGPAAAIALVGHAGVGKSRLATWLVAEAHAAGGAVPVRVRCGEPTALADGLRQAIGRTADLPDLLDGLGAPPDLADPAAQWLDGAALGPRDRGELARELLTALAGHRRVALWLDDAHLADPAELLALSRVAGRALVVATSRTPEALPDGFEQVALGPLGDDAVLEMLEGMVGLAPSLALEIARASDGNPQVAALRVAGPLSRGELVAGPDGLSLPAGASLAAPDAALDPWAAPLNDATGGDPTALRAVALAALLGDPVPIARWQAIGPVPDGLRDALVRHHAWLDDGVTIRWAHALLRDAAIAWAERDGCARTLHARTRAQLESDGGDPGRIGEHALRAGDATEAIPWLRRALYHAVTHGRPGEADHLDRLLDEAFDRVGEGHPLRGEHLLEKARLLYMRYRGQRDEVLGLLARARAALSAHGDPGFLRVVAWLEATCRVDHGDLLAARAVVDAALALPGGPPAIDVRLLHIRARTAYPQGDAWGARADLVEGVRRARARDDRAGVADALGSLAILHHLCGDLDGAERLYRTAGEAHERDGAGFGVASIRFNLAELARERGELDRASELVDQAHRTMRAMGRHDASARLARVTIARSRGDHATAREILSRFAVGESRVAHALRLEDRARDGDAAGWDDDFARGAPAVGLLALELHESLGQAAALARDLGWTERADAAHQLLAGPLGVRAALRACGVRGVDDVLGG